MKLYSYIVRDDTGFSPNPFFGYCTLACCKPDIRRKAEVGDWIVGLTPKATGNKVVYFMRVDEIMLFGKYWWDPRFKEKKPKLHAGPVAMNGDNIYQPSNTGSLGYHQLPSDHSDKNCRQRENVRFKEWDLSGEQVLVSRTFAYFGSKPKDLPQELRDLIVGRGRKYHFSETVKTDFLDFVSKQKFGVHAPPRQWPEHDHAWRVAAGSKA